MATCLPRLRGAMSETISAQSLAFIRQHPTDIMKNRGHQQYIMSTIQETDSDFSPSPSLVRFDM